MPELPEVETIRRQLVDKVRGLKIEKVDVNKPKLFIGDKDKVIGATFTDIDRRAKTLIFRLDNGYSMLAHLKMSGQFIFVDSSGRYGGGHPVPPMNSPVPNSSTHVIFHLCNKSILYFNEIRQFGWIKVLDKKELDKELEKLGPEPLSADFTYPVFKNLIKNRFRTKIKQALMDQSLIAGIGNIYAAEILYYAGVKPDRTISTLTNSELVKIFDGIKKILPEAIKYQGTSADAYVTLSGEKGDYESRLKVYGRAGQKCACGGVVKKIKLGGRGTYYCPACQK